MTGDLAPEAVFDTIARRLGRIDLATHDLIDICGRHPVASDPWPGRASYQLLTLAPGATFDGSAHDQVGPVGRLLEVSRPVPAGCV